MRVHGFNYLTCPESSKAPVRDEDEDVKSLQVIYTNRSFHFKGVLNNRPVAKTADLIVMMLDATKSLEQRRLLEIELDAVGIRLNKKKPDVVFKRKQLAGLVESLFCPKFNTPLAHVPNRLWFVQ